MTLFPETRMLRAAKSARTRTFPAFVTVLFCFLVFFVAASIEEIVLVPAIFIYVFTDEALMEEFAEMSDVMREALMSGDMETYTDKATEISDKITAAMPMWFILLELFVTVAVIGAVLIFTLKIEKRSAESLGLHKRNGAVEYFGGLLIGTLLFSGAVGICVLSGSVTLSANESPNVLLILLALLGFAVQGFSEEILCRGFLMVSLSRRQPMWVCITVSSLFFACLHLGNPNLSAVAFINLILFGVVAAMYTLRRGNLWGIAALHTAWNFVQGNLFGIQVSGLSQMESLFVTTLGEEKAEVLFNGGLFGLEGGIGVTAILVIGIGVLLFIPTKQDEIAQPVTDGQTSEPLN